MTRERLNVGGTANFAAYDDSNFVVAMTGVFDGGAQAEITGTTEEADGLIKATLRHRFINNSGSIILTEDESLQKPQGDGRVYAQTHYNVIKATGEFEGYKGSFDSWGAIDFNTGEGVLRFEGHLERGD